MFTWSEVTELVIEAVIGGVYVGAGYGIRITSTRALS
jgi:uncharacterized membrane-anchored protein YitT (DUF2179 family)